MLFRSWGHALRYYEWSEYSQAKWDLRRMINDWSMGIRSSIFTLVDLQYPNMQQSFGLLRTNLLKQVVYKRPSFHAVQHTANLLNSAIESGGALQTQANTTRQISAVAMQKEGKRIGALLWYSDRVPSDDLQWDEVEVTVEGVKLRDPVLVDLLTGRVYALPKDHGAQRQSGTKFTGLPLWDSPVAIVERGAIAFHERGDQPQAAGTKNDMYY